MSLTAVLLLAGLASAQQVDDDTLKCLKTAGKLGAKCTVQALKLFEEVVSPPPAILDGDDPQTSGKVFQACTSTAQARTLGFRDRSDIARQINDGCKLFALDLHGTVYNEDQTGLTPDQLACRLAVYKRMAKIHKAVTGAWGKKCTLPDYQQKPCDRAKRDGKITKTRASGEAAILKACSADFDALGTFDGVTLEDRIATFVAMVVTRGRHWAERIYPPNNGGPSGELGPFNVGLTTLELEDASRLNVDGDGPRPVVTEVYYPATDEAVEGVPEEVVEIFGLTLFPIPAYRDVTIAPDAHPLIVFSHGNNGTRIQSFFFAQQLASHGFVVISPDHHGNTFPDTAGGTIDPDSATNRPLDVSFLIDEFTGFNSEPGNFFENQIDVNKIGMSGHSFGGYTSFAVAGGAFALGTFTDTRVKAIFPQAPAASFFEPEFFQSITIPTLVVGGTIDETTPFDEHQQMPYDELLSGAAVVGLAAVQNAGHFTFSSFCEVNPALLAFLGGFEEACEPRHLPWRHAQDITMYLAHNFFDAVLNGDAAALARLAPATVAAQFDDEDLVYQSK